MVIKKYRAADRSCSDRAYCELTWPPELILDDVHRRPFAFEDLYRKHMRADATLFGFYPEYE